MEGWLAVESLLGALEVLPLLLCLAIAGCARDAYPTGPSPSTASAVVITTGPRLSRTRFLAFGDSLTSGEVTAPASGSGTGVLLPRGGNVVLPAASYPTQLFHLLTTRYREQAAIIDVVNAGLGGEQADQGAARFSSTCVAAEPEAVLLLEGVNGINDGTDPIIRALTRMVEDAEELGTRVFIATLVPTLEGRQRSQSVLRIQELNARIARLAAAEDAVLVDLYTAMLPDAGTLIGVDGLHPTEAGYKRMAELFFDAIRADLEVR
jgi:lysophospholipase L1-like esterase